MFNMKICKLWRGNKLTNIDMIKEAAEMFEIKPMIVMRHLYLKTNYDKVLSKEQKKLLAEKYYQLILANKVIKELINKPSLLRDKMNYEADSIIKDFYRELLLNECRKK